jgi:peptidoglycan/xylan/chitin deacetylase (PgdA/CDA1 family)
VRASFPPVRCLLWLTSTAGFLCLGSALAGRALPLSWVIPLLALHALVATLGVLLPGLSVYGDVLSHGSRARAEVALTFDDGPHPETTRRVLAILREHGVTATFFVLGEKARAHPDVVREIVQAGHGLGVHGHVHDRLYSLRSAARVSADLERARAMLRQVASVEATLFRPPVGFVSHSVALAAERAGVTLVGFSARMRDGAPRAEPQAVLARARRALANGAVLVLHDAAERGEHVPASIAVLGELCRELARRGLRPVTVDALLRAE